MCPSLLLSLQAPAANPNPADDSVMTGQFPPIQPATDYQNAVVFRTSCKSFCCLLVPAAYCAVHWVLHPPQLQDAWAPGRQLEAEGAHPLGPSP